MVELAVAGERYKPVCSVDRSLVTELLCSWWWAVLVVPVPPPPPPPRSAHGRCSIGRRSIVHSTLATQSIGI